MPVPAAGALFAGFDVSTQSAKLVVVDPASQTVCHVDRVEYDRDLPHYGTIGGAVAGLGDGVSESDPRMWVEAVELLLRRLGESKVPPAAIRCVSVSGQQHGLVALTAQGELARPRAKLWNDFSTAEECRVLTEAVGGDRAMIAEVGNTQRTGYTASKILHLKRHEPEHYACAATLFLVHNYVNWHLTGGAESGVAVMEPGDTSGMALWHPGTERWSQRVLAVIDPALTKKLPPLRPSDRPIGRVGRTLVQQFGFSPDCWVDAGSGDNMYGAVGTGNVAPGILTVSLGTSGTAYSVLEEPFIDPTGEIAAFRDSTGRHLPLVCVSNMANGYDALLAQFGLTHQEFDAIVARTPPATGGRVILPWYVGERTPDLPAATPVYFGFGSQDLVPEVLCRAVLEGHVLNLCEACRRLPVQAGEIRVTGGLSTSPSWRQIIADIFEAEVLPVSGEGAALGAAIHAAWVWYREAGQPRELAELAAAFVVLDESRRRRPAPEHVARYSLLGRLFRALSRRVRGLDGEDPFELRRQLKP